MLQGTLHITPHKDLDPILKHSQEPLCFVSESQMAAFAGLGCERHSYVLEGMLLAGAQTHEQAHMQTCELTRQKVVTAVFSLLQDPGHPSKAPPLPHHLHGVTALAVQLPHLTRRQAASGLPPHDGGTGGAALNQPGR